MKIIKAYPPNFAEIAKRFPVKGKLGILYAWGDRLYNPSGGDVPPWIMAHETVHGERQCGDCIGSLDIWNWWDCYLKRPEFRRNEEILAHRAEWQAFSVFANSVENKQAYLYLIATRLSGPLYGSMISLKDAIQEIQDA